MKSSMPTRIRVAILAGFVFVAIPLVVLMVIKMPARVVEESKPISSNSDLDALLLSIDEELKGLDSDLSHASDSLEQDDSGD